MSIKIVLLSLAFVLVSAQAQNLGGLEPVSTDDPEVQSLAKVALTNLETSAGGNDKLTLVKIIKADKQVVSGFMHHLELEVSNSKGESKICKVSIVEGPSSKEPKVTEASCENKPLTV